MADAMNRDVLRRTRDMVSQVRHLARLGHVEEFADLAGRIRAMVSGPEFPQEQAGPIPAMLETLALLAAKVKMTFECLAEAETRAAVRPLSREQLKELTDTARRAMELGAGDDFERRVIAGVGRVMEMSRAASDRLAPPDLHPQRRRRATRHFLPRLTVELDGRTYQTVNWSSRGLLLGGVGTAFGEGLTVSPRISCDGVEGGGVVTATVVRYNPGKHELALSLKHPAPVILLLKAKILTTGLTLTSAPGHGPAPGQ